MSSVLGGATSIFTAAWDEPFAIPTQESAELALRTQQILAYETGVADVADPLGGSYYVEALTDATELAVTRVIEKIEEQGGMVRCVEEGVVQQMIADEAYRKHGRLERGEDVIVGVNRFQTEQQRELTLFALDSASQSTQLERLREVRAKRDPAAVERALERLRETLISKRNCMPALIEAAEAYCTIGEMAGAMRAIFGEFREPIVV
jgi:methylmalonyl-CoA mutase N-terminal domain/subunit